MIDDAKGDSDKEPTAETVKLTDEDGKARPLVDIMLDLGIKLDGKALNQVEVDYAKDFGNDEKTAKKHIERFLELAGAEDAAGLETKLLTVWKRATAKPPKPKKLPDLPELPPDQKFDLTAPTIKLEGVSYKIPTSAVTATVDIEKWPTPQKFSISQWLALFKTKDLLYGLDVNRALSTSQELYSNARAKKAALSFVMPRNPSDAFLFDTRAAKGSTATYSEILSNGVHNMMIGGEVHGSCPYGSAQASGKYVEETAEAQGSKTIFVSAYWLMPFVEIRMTECTKPSDAFLKAVESAVHWNGEGEPPEMPEADALEEQFHALEEVFDTFGHVVSDTVGLGGAMYFTSRNTVSEASQKSDVEKVAKLAVDAKVGGSGGGMSASFEKKDKTEMSAKEMQDSQSWIAHGGNRTLVGAPQEWSQTLYDPDHWAICSRKGTRPLVEWLDDGLKKRVNDVWEKGLRDIYWGGRKRPADHQYPMLKNKPFQIRTGPRLGEGALRATDGKWRGNWSWYDMFLYKDISGNEEYVDKFYWTLVYSGLTTLTDGAGDPYYFIVTWGSENAAASLRQLGQPGRECNALQALDGEWAKSNDHATAHAVAQVDVWNEGRIEKKYPLDDLLWTVEPIIDEDADHGQFTRYRVRAKNGWGLHKDADAMGKNDTSIDKEHSIGTLRIRRDAGEIYLIPE